MADGNRATVQSVERALDILEALARADDAQGLTALIKETELPLATVHRLLGTLARRGYIRQDPGSRRYLLEPNALLFYEHRDLGEAHPERVMSTNELPAEFAVTNNKRRFEAPNPGRNR